MAAINHPGQKLLAAFEISGRPVPKGRPRFGRGRTYTDAATLAFEETVATFARREMGRRPVITTPVGVAVIFEQTDGRLADIDNLTKSLLDGISSQRASKDRMGRVGPVLANDSQVIELRARLVRRAEADRTTVCVYEVADEPTPKETK